MKGFPLLLLYNDIGNPSRLVTARFDSDARSHTLTHVATTKMITQWHLPCLVLGNLCCFLFAMETRVNQSGLKLVCSGNILFLCSANVPSDCIDTSLCKTKEEKQRNETERDIFMTLREALCTHSSSNCSYNHGNSRVHFMEHQNTTSTSKLTDCWSLNKKSTDYTPELFCSAVVFLSITIMFLSYLCLKKTLAQYLSRRQKPLLIVRPNQRNNVDLL
ncbi:uncharacterized protein LOC143782459 [Ranitomeya variabilis]|uniref:uncharacterized protein LOC143782459 n=1 Tax=Ranitomeya variabilis TaxID=490064 RepID=UPI004057649D